VSVERDIFNVYSCPRINWDIYNSGYQRRRRNYASIGARCGFGQSYHGLRHCAEGKLKTIEHMLLEADRPLYGVDIIGAT
jgi:hypothetical protein